MRPATPLFLAAALAVGGFACASDDEAASPPPPPVAAEPEDPFEGTSTDVGAAEAQGDATALLERLEIGRHEGFDRVVFQFRNAVPGYRLEYVEPPLHEDGSGNVIAVQGTAFLLVRMEPASGFDLSVPEGELVYEGPRRLSGADAGATAVREVVRIGDFEAVLTWAVGLDERVPFRVQTLGSPARLVVDFRS